MPSTTCADAKDENPQAVPRTLTTGRKKERPVLSLELHFNGLPVCVNVAERRS